MQKNVLFCRIYVVKCRHILACDSQASHRSDFSPYGSHFTPEHVGASSSQTHVSTNPHSVLSQKTVFLGQQNETSAHKHNLEKHTTYHFASQ